MSTRANIVIKDGSEKLFFYRHSDGYPDGTMPALNKFMEWVKAGYIRDNISQSAGWLVLLGHLEYNKYVKTPTIAEENISKVSNPDDWKIGAFEPTTGIHGDIEYLYIIDLEAKTVKCYEDWTDEGMGKGRATKLKTPKTK